jgi:hemolysin D
MKQASTALVPTLSQVQQFIGRCHDPLDFIANEESGRTGRLVLRAVMILVLVMLLWAVFGKLDIVVSADGRLVPKTLVKIVQPAESGVVKALLVNEGDHVHAGQVLARLDTTVASADKEGVANDLHHQLMQERRIVAELTDSPMLSTADDDTMLFTQVQNQFNVHRHAFIDSIDQEKALLSKARNEYRSAARVYEKIQQSLPVYERSAQAYQQLEQQGFFSPLATADKQREAHEKTHDLEAQHATVAALKDTIAAQEKRLSQLKKQLSQ